MIDTKGIDRCQESSASFEWALSRRLTWGLRVSSKRLAACVRQLWPGISAMPSAGAASWELH